jgi:hypothetical protein
MGDQRGSGTTGREGQDNVVQLPRDWLGPREELVPFGPRAWAQDTSADLAAEEEGAFAADDFWGENSESLHTAVRGPAAPPAPVPVEDATATSSRPRISLHIPALAAMAVAATVAGVVVLALLGGGRPTAAPVIAASANAQALIGHLSSTGGTIDAGVRRLASLRLSTPIRSRRRPGSPRRRHKAATGAVGAASSGGGAAASTPTQPAPSYTPSSTSSSAGAAVTSGSASNSAGAGSNSSGPSNQPAFGANGTLGPGSSPNG